MAAQSRRKPVDKMKEEKNQAIYDNDSETPQPPLVDHRAPLTADDWADHMILFPEPRY
jgi:hypothetical protein